MSTFNAPTSLMEKWAPVLNEESAGVIKDRHRKAVTAMVLENQEQALAEQALTEGPTNAASAADAIAKYLSDLLEARTIFAEAYDFDSEVVPIW